MAKKNQMISWDDIKLVNEKNGFIKSPHKDNSNNSNGVMFENNGIKFVIMKVKTKTSAEYGNPNNFILDPKFVNFDDQLLKINDGITNNKSGIRIRKSDFCKKDTILGDYGISYGFANKTTYDNFQKKLIQINDEHF